MTERDDNDDLGRPDYDVVVVGLGPTGAVLSALLGLGGIRVLAIDRDKHVHPLPRAAHFDHEIMRIFQQVGISDRLDEHVREAGRYEFRSASGEILHVARSGEETTPSGWCFSYMFNQPGLERALRKRLNEIPAIDVELGEEFVSLSQRRGRVEVVLRNVEKDTTRSLSSRFLVGCDGAWSPVREALGIALEDLRFDEPWLVVDTIPSDPTYAPSANVQICDPARPTTSIAMGPGRHRWEFMLLPGEETDDVLAPGFAEALLEPWGVDVEVERKAVYTFHGLVAEQWSRGCVFLAGDAAHQMPPFAGQGMCSGIRDAANLAWKLEAVVRATATARLLDSYQEEREPHVRAFVDLAIAMGRVVCILDPAQAAKRDAHMLRTGEFPPSAKSQPARPVDIETSRDADPLAGTPFPQFRESAGEREALSDDVLGRGAVIIHRGALGSEAADCPASLRSVDVDADDGAPFDHDIARWLEAQQVEAVIVRPDRYVFGSGEAQELVSAWKIATNAPRGDGRVMEDAA